MSLIVVDSYENLVNFKNILRVILIDNNDFESTKHSIDVIKCISNEISISVLSQNNIYDNYSNVNTIQVTTENFILKINNLLLENYEKFFCILYSGDILLDSFDNSISNAILDNDVGAIVFDDYLINEKKHNYKPHFSPDLYLEYDYINNALFFNREAVNSIEGFDITLSHNFIRDAVFRLFFKDFKINKEDKICFELCHVLNDPTSNENKIFLNKQLNSQNAKFDILDTGKTFKPVYDVENKKASIIIPFKDQAEVTRTCVESIIEKTEYENYEIILINNNSSEEETFKFIGEMSQNSKISNYTYSGPFNWSKINNFGASVSSGEVLIFLNNDTEVISENWLTLLIGDAIQKRVGVVGPKLFYPDKTIQHAGVVIGLNSLAAHLFAGNHEDEIPEVYNIYRRNVSSVTGACLAVEKEIFNQVNRFNERFEVSFSDIELCLRLLELGYDNIFNPDAKLFHHEMKTRSNKEFREIDRILGYSAFSYYFKNGDPFFNTNYSLNNSNKLTLKNKDEIPGFKRYWDNWSRNRNNRVNKIHDIIDKKNKFSNYDFSNDDWIKNGILMDNFFKNSNLTLDNVLWFIPAIDNYDENVLFNLFLLPNFLSENEKTNNIFALEDINNKLLIQSYLQNNFSKLKFKIISDCNNLPNVDVAFCLDWKTAYKLLKYNNCSVKYYLINDDYKDHNILLKNQSYHFDFIGLANSQKSVSDYEKYNKRVSYFDPIINNECYFVDETVNKINRSVLFHAGGLSEVEFEFGIEILKIVKEYFGNGIKIFVEGKEFDSSDYNLNDMVVNLGILESSKKLAQYYNQSQVVLNLKTSENLIYKILNSMACGCVNITPFNDNLPIFLRDNENIIFTFHSLTSISEDVIRLLHDVNLRDKVSNVGLNTIKQLNSKNELQHMVDYIKNPNKTHEDIENNTKVIHLNNLETENEQCADMINKLKLENIIHRNKERDFKLINSRNVKKINKLNQELNQLKFNKNNSIVKKFLK